MTLVVLVRKYPLRILRLFTIAYLLSLSTATAGVENLSSGSGSSKSSRWLFGNLRYGRASYTDFSIANSMVVTRRYLRSLRPGIGSSASGTRIQVGDGVADNLQNYNLVDSIDKCLHTDRDHTDQLSTSKQSESNAVNDGATFSASQWKSVEDPNNTSSTKIHGIVHCRDVVRSRLLLIVVAVLYGSQYCVQTLLQRKVLSSSPIP